MEPLDTATKRAFQTALEYILRPREEVIDHQKAHEEALVQSYGENILKHPLALLPPDLEIPQTDNSSASPSRLEELINTNVRLNKELRQLQEASRTSSDASAERQNAPLKHLSGTTTASDTQDSDVIALQLQVNALEEKRTRLNIFLGALDKLETLPAAEPDYLHPSSSSSTGTGGMFEHCSPLPEMPKELMEGFTRDTSAPKHEIETMMRGLHKAVLRNKLLAQREKRKLDALREEEGESGMNDPSTLPADVQMYALSAVKDHLISWIESQLMQAGDDEEEDDDEGSAKPNSSSKSAARNGHHDDDVDLDTRLGDIQHQYDSHIALRKEIGSLLAEADKVSHDLEKFRGMRITDQSPDTTTPNTIAPRNTTTTTIKPLSTTLNPPAALLLTPYLEKLQQTSREQKALVQEKSHINSAIAKQQQHMSQTIQDLIEGSQLLAAYPNAAPSSSRRSSSHSRGSFGDFTRRSAGNKNKASVATQVEPFVYSADSAKIATLEAVVEKIELGQMAVGEARERLDEVRKFLDKPDSEEEPAPVPSGHRRRNTEGMIIVEEKSIWSKLDGNLGLIND